MWQSYKKISLALVLWVLSLSACGGFDAGIEANSIHELDLEGENSLIYDLTAPIPVLVSDEGAVTSSEPITVMLSFSENIQDLAWEDFELSNAKLLNLESLDDQTYLLEIMPILEGEVQLSLPAGAVEDLAGNLSEASNVFSVEYRQVLITISKEE
ncbi:MAG: hypothetical protein KDK66_08570 [Deltaproteobacteria bacterium]|nr:hypothetical protein [Deltaproteobacteria bacterium]